MKYHQKNVVPLVLAVFFIIVVASGGCGADERQAVLGSNVTSQTQAVRGEKDKKSDDTKHDDDDDDRDTEHDNNRDHEKKCHEHKNTPHGRAYGFYRQLHECEDDEAPPVVTQPSSSSSATATRSLPAVQGATVVQTYSMGTASNFFAGSSTSGPSPTSAFSASSSTSTATSLAPESSSNQAPSSSATPSSSAARSSSALPSSSAAPASVCPPPPAPGPADSRCEPGKPFYLDSIYTLAAIPTHQGYLNRQASIKIFGCAPALLTSLTAAISFDNELNESPQDLTDSDGAQLADGTPAINNPRFAFTTAGVPARGSQPMVKESIVVPDAVYHAQIVDETSPLGHICLYLGSEQNVNIFFDLTPNSALTVQQPAYVDWQATASFGGSQDIQRGNGMHFIIGP